MAAEQKFPLSLIVRAVDKASGPLKSITASINASTAPMRGLGKDFKGLGEALNVEGFQKVGGALMGVGSAAFTVATRIAGLAAGAALAFGTVIHGAMESGDKLAENADRVGLTIDSYASLAFAAAQADIDQESFTAGMDKLNKQMGDMKAGKGGEFLAFLNEISPTFAKQVQGAKGTEAAFFLLTDAMAKLPDTQRQATLAAHAFGKANTQFGRFMHPGTKAILEQEAAYMRLHGSSEKFANGASDLDNATKATAAAFFGLRDAAAGALFPALTKVANVTSEFFVKNREGIAKWADKAGAAITAWVDSGGFDRLVNFLGQVADGAGKVIDFLGPMGVAIVGGAILFAPLIAAVGSLAIALVGVLPVIIAIGPEVLAVVGAVGALTTAGVLLWKKWDEIEQKFTDVGNTLRWALVDGWNTVRPILAAMSSAMPALGMVVKMGDSASQQASQAIGASTGQSVDAITARDARANAPFNAAGPTGIHLSRVQVDFANLPPGVRVRQDRDSQPIDMSMGYALSGGW